MGVHVTTLRGLEMEGEGVLPQTVLQVLAQFLTVEDNYFECVAGVNQSQITMSH